MARSKEILTKVQRNLPASAAEAPFSVAFLLFLAFPHYPSVDRDGSSACHALVLVGSQL